MRLEQGPKDKFWKAEVSGSTLTITSGDAGTAGKSETKSFPTPYDASEALTDALLDNARRRYHGISPEEFAELLGPREPLDVAQRSQPHEAVPSQKAVAGSSTSLISPVKTGPSPASAGSEKGYGEVTAEAEAAQVDEDDDEPIPPPPDFSKPTTWEAIAKAWSVAGAARGEQYRASDVQGVVNALGIRRLPPSYLVYLERFKQLGELEQRYEREDFPYFLNIYTPDLLDDQRDQFRKLLDMFFDSMTAEGQKIIEAARKLIPFGFDTSRTDICWDPSRTAPDGEMAICFYNHEFTRNTNAGRDLKEVVKYYRPHYR